MNARRVGVLFAKDLRYGSRNFVFVFAIVMPVVLSLVMGLLFGTLLSDKPRLGIADAGASALTTALQSDDFMTVQMFPSEDALLQAMDTGGVEIGLSLPPNFDTELQAGEDTDLTFFVWGQSLLKNRAIISAAVAEEIVDLTARETPVTINSVMVGDRAAVSWQQRLLPLIVLMSVMFGGMLVPATSMIEERQKRTLTAVTTTPMTMSEVLLTKGLMGALLSVVSAIVILTLNGGWGPDPLLLFVALALGGTFAACVGVLVGSRVKDIQTLFALSKSTGILVYAPALIALFPDAIPAWVARLFPTYYILQPVLSISQQGAGLNEVGVDLLVLLVMTALLIAGVRLTAERLQVQAA